MYGVGTSGKEEKCSSHVVSCFFVSCKVRGQKGRQRPNLINLFRVITMLLLIKESLLVTVRMPGVGQLDLKNTNESGICESFGQSPEFIFYTIGC